MWFQKAGVTRVGEPVTLTGAVYSWNRVVGDLASVNFSFDMGQDLAEGREDRDQVTDFDPVQWVTYSLDWTPSKAGKYQVKLKPRMRAASDEEARHAVLSERRGNRKGR
ncbi:MAG: hypothetical protein ACLTDR_15035 [Adlercreutzia equolifaciens]